ncbi:MAG: metal ABC transporter substrate-binding protein, partial [Candidatus Edwardsbacteria bacterium]|nr:metal ABC transporter substrate-binding protein [Candidatus Edwardsbacteria bacterium]
MKAARLLRWALAVLGAVLAGCGGPGPRHEMVIATSFYPMYLATANLAAGVPGVRVVNVARPSTGCLHDYQLTPQDLRTLAGAEVLVINGGGMESFVDKAVAQLPRLIVVDASRGIELIRDGQGAVNPHVWVSVSGAMAQVRAIAEGLAAADPEHAAAYRANAAAYLAKLDALRQRMHGGLKGIRTRDIITFHEAFPYFAREFGLTVAAVIEREPGAEPSAAELAATIDLVRAKGITALFAEPQYPARAA